MRNDIIEAEVREEVVREMQVGISRQRDMYERRLAEEVSEISATMTPMKNTTELQSHRLNHQIEAQEAKSDMKIEILRRSMAASATTAFQRLKAAASVPLNTSIDEDGDGDEAEMSMEEAREEEERDVDASLVSFAETR